MPNVTVEPKGEAPGHPGIRPTWTSSAKDVVGCTLGASRLWFTLGFGIVNEVYYPRVDLPQIRDLGFVVADGKGFWTEVKRLKNYTLSLLAPGTPAVEIAHAHERFTLTLRVTPDPDRDVLVIDLKLAGDDSLRPYVLLAPRLGASGDNNTAEIRRHGARRVLIAEQGPFALALAAVGGAQEDAFGTVSAGYVGESDGWQDFKRNGALTWSYAKAGPGNVALVGALPREAVLGLAFGSSGHAASSLAVSGLLCPFQDVLQRQIDDWQKWHERRRRHARVQRDEPAQLSDLLEISSIVLQSHRDKTFPGTMVASLSVPWGNSRDDRAGYHLVWPRDLVQCTTALLELGAQREARNTLRYLIATQRDDGSWNQNQWLGGMPYWQGQQLDETALPVLLAAALDRRGALGGIEVADMVHRALSFLARTGPSSMQDRWEEDEGINAFTLAVCIAGLVAGADFLPEPSKSFALALADFWNANVENWMAVKATPLAGRLGIEGHYAHVAPPETITETRPLRDLLASRKRAREGFAAEEVISADFLQLVRYGLRRPDDPLVLDSIKAVDSVLKVETPNGPVWRRYTGDCYGEYDDGRPYDGGGRGRPWPLLTGERGHYELSAGRDPLAYLEAMAAMTGPAGMIPEQVWDGDSIPERRLLYGKPTGSAMPLAWAHAEFIKLFVSRHIGHPVDRPDAVWRRYQGRRPEVARTIWTLSAQISHVCSGSSLTIVVPRPARIHRGFDGWQNVKDVYTQPIGLDLHGVELAAAMLARAHTVDFTIQWRDTSAWIGSDFRISVERQRAR